jgi:glucosamine--fructose-6-phosphate aminotransferase (isomerizing)
MENRRLGHPYHMHDAILAQPEAFVHAVRRNMDAVDLFAAEASSCGQLFLVGIGSHHAALVGEHLFRAYGGGLDVRAAHSFDFALYGAELGPADCVVGVSHRGTKRYSFLALRRAREVGCKTALITGEGDAATPEGDHVFRTVAQERSSAHTVSYAGAVAVLALLASRLGGHRTGAQTLDAGVLQGKVPAALRVGLSTEVGAVALTGEHSGRRRIWLVGGGPDAVTASEAALKIKETSYLQAEGVPTETMLYGPFQCVEAEDLFVLIAPEGAARERTLEIAGLAEEVGSAVVVVDDGVGDVPPSAERLMVCPVPEAFSTLTCLVPLQLFSYHLALARGTNPDNFRTDDPRFARADVSGHL